MRSPILFLVFNRPETTRRVFDAIRAARPPKLYVAADGPRANAAQEAQRCEEVRRIATAVDWPCEVHTLFRDRNLGCKIGVSSAVSWFFEHEFEGIILEDDVLPTPTFFQYCDELLEKYREDERVGMITGCNLISHYFKAAESYFFSRYNHIWGWASWRRAWQHYDVAMADWPVWRDGRGLEQMSAGNPLFAAYWRPIFNAVHEGKVDTWDYQWTFACWRHGSLAAMPAFNQTRNLGFGADATHTTKAEPAYVVSSRVHPLAFPLLHPDPVARDLRADALIDSKVFGINILNVLVRRLLKSPMLRSVASSLRQQMKNAIG
jgi:hypothetical protein